MAVLISPDIAVAVIDDHPLFRAGVVHALLGSSGLKVVAEGDSASEAIQIAGKLAPDVLILSVDLIGGGMETARSICRDHPQTKVMILTVNADANTVMTALRAGIAGYVVKGVSGAELCESIRRVHRGERYVFASLAATLLSCDQPSPQERSAPIADLSPREEQILFCLGRGLSNKEIGRSLRLSEKTIKHYLTGLLSKLQVRNRVEAAILAAAYPRRFGNNGLPPVGLALNS